jgi:alpha-ketoglutarate-dependent taurine dioxygenase
VSGSPRQAVELQIKKLTDTVGAQVLDVDRDRLLCDSALPDAVLDALEEYSVLVLPAIGVDDEEQVAFGRRLGDLVTRPGHAIPEVTVITQDPGNHLAEYFKGNLLWHIDGAQDDVPCKAAVMTARVILPDDPATEFASTYAAYDQLSDAEKERFADLQVVHKLESTMRKVIPDPTPEQLADWATRGPAKEHPLVWKHRSGRKSIVVGSSADHIVGMDLDEGRALLADLLERATRPDLVLRHDWTVGDLVIWDNTGLLHRVTHHDPRTRRELHRVTVAGEEPIQ